MSHIFNYLGSSRSFLKDRVIVLIKQNALKKNLFKYHYLTIHLLKTGFAKYPKSPV